MPRPPRTALAAAALLVAAGALSCGGGSTGAADGQAPRNKPKRALAAASPEERQRMLDARFGAVQEIRKGPSPVLFTDVTKDAGVDFIQTNGRSESLYYVEILGTGVAFFDADGDGDMDLFFGNGRRLDPPPEVPPPGSRFYLNDGKGHFTDATQASGLANGGYQMGACAADYDNDGDQDLYVNHFDEKNAFYRNDGKGRFTDIAAKAGVPGGPDTDSSCSWGDVDGDGWVDLFVGYYVDHSVKNNVECREARRDGGGVIRRYCNPKDYKPLHQILYRNKKDGTFEDWSAHAGFGDWTGRALSADFTDFDDDGDLDLFIACDRTSNGFFVNDGTGRFADISVTNGTGLSDEGIAQAGMGSTTGDFDEDGRMDVAATYFEREANGIYRNLGGNQFENIAARSGTARPSFFLLAWGTELFDADLDSHLDWMVVNGHVLPNAEAFREPVAGYAQPKLFFLGRGDGTFENMATAAGPPFATDRVGRGLATADIDGDGDLDVVVSNQHDAPELLRNDSPRDGRHWLMLHPIGTKSNRDAIGTRLTLHHPDGRRLIREVKTGQSYLSQSDMRVHWGLGDASKVPLIEVRWPSGRTSRLENVAADQVLTVREP